jgi:hypothetical protein
MSNVHDLQRYVKRHPDDRAQRWRLAKKLYMAGDFEDALAHLRVLRKHWPTKLNVARYLAATHYRMGNHNKAIRELEKSLEAWPEELPIRQQLARILESAGLHSAATRAWQEIISRQPNHPFAREALNNLSQPKSDAPPQPIAAPETGRKCPSCGAENGDEFERCWQCHAALTADEKVDSSEPPAAAPYKPAAHLIDLQDHTPVTITAIVMALIAIGISGYCFYDAWAIQNTPPADLVSSAKVHTVLATQLFSLRMSIAIVLAIFCPIALYATSFAARIPMPEIGTITAIGLANAGAAITLTWLPLAFLMYAPFVFTASAFALIIWLYAPRYVRGTAIAAVQCIFVFALTAGAAFQVEGPEFVKQLPTIIQYGAKHDSQSNPGREALDQLPLPTEYSIQFATTGSAWLNEHGNAIRIEIGSDQPADLMDIELFEYEKSIAYYSLDPATIPFNAQLGRPYRLTLGGKKSPSSTQGAVIGILPLQIHAETEKPEATKI